MDALRPVALPDEAEQRLRLLAGWVALIWCALFGWFSVLHGGDVPVLWLLQLAVHEMGHWVFATFGERTMLLMGSGAEILVPILLGVGCVVWRTKRNLIAAGMCWAVAAGAFVHTAAYIADAPLGEATLIGGESDWLILLDEHWDVLYKAHVYAGWARTAGLIVWLAAVGLVVVGMALARRGLATPTFRVSAEPSAPVAPIDPNTTWG